VAPALDRVTPALLDGMRAADLAAVDELAELLRVDFRAATTLEALERLRGDLNLLRRLWRGLRE
jgi:hypothetical protein